MMPPLESKLIYTYMEIENCFQTYNRISHQDKFLTAPRQTLRGFCHNFSRLRVTEPQPQKSWGKIKNKTKTKQPTKGQTTCKMNHLC